MKDTQKLKQQTVAEKKVIEEVVKRLRRTAEIHRQLAEQIVATIDGTSVESGKQYHYGAAHTLEQEANAIASLTNHNSSTQ